MQTTRYTSETLVDVYPFTRQPEGSEVVIGRVGTGVFFALPVEAAELLDQLAEGKTVGEVRDLHQGQYGQVPDMEDFLSLLESKGLVGPAGSGPPRAQGRRDPERVELSPGFLISRSLAQRLFGTTALTLVGALAAVAAGLALFDPTIIPGRNSLFFQDHRTVKMLILVTINLAGIFVHEMAHVVAARAAGIYSRIRISHRLWILVAETDMTGLWAVPKRERYVPFLAGPIVDTGSASLLFIALFADAHSRLALPGLAREMAAALLFSCFMRLLWQCFFFVRTDFYYVVTSFFGCRNMLKDTEAFLRNQLARAVPRLSKVDQSAIPTAEMRFIRAYAPLWLLGRVIALSMLFLVTLPVAGKYLVTTVTTLGAGYSAHPGQFIDAVGMIVFSFTPLTIGLTLWIRSLVRGSRRQR
jgi:hypothetical protein